MTNTVSFLLLIMIMKKQLTRSELIFHPVRIQIVSVIMDRPSTPKEMADQLDDIPLSSLYRHLNILLENSMVEVVSSVQVGSVQEKTYALTDNLRFSDEDVVGWTPDEYLEHFNSYVVGIMGLMRRYVRQTDSMDEINAQTDWRVYRVDMTDDEWLAFSDSVHEQLASFESAEPNSQARLFHLITHPRNDSKQAKKE